MRVRNIVVTPEWLKEQKAPPKVWVWVRLARWQVHWRGDRHPTIRDLLTGPALPLDVTRWLVNNLPLPEDLRLRLRRASGQDKRRRIIEGIEEKPSRRRRRPVDTSAEEAKRGKTKKTRAGAKR